MRFPFHLPSPHRRWRRILLALLLFPFAFGLMASACRVLGGAPRLVAGQYWEKHALNKYYRLKEGYLTECIGRHLFDVSEELEWATADTYSDDDGSKFGKNIAQDVDGFYYDGVSITLTKPADEKGFEHWDSVYFMQYGMPSSSTNQLGGEQDMLDYMKGNTEMSDEERAKYVAEIEGRIKAIKANLDYPRTFDSGIPGARSYQSMSGFAIVIWSSINKRVYGFSLQSDYQNAEQYAKDRAKLVDFVKNRFHERETFHWPEQAGVCIPYGFLTGPNQADYLVEGSFRLVSTPSVLYSVIVGRNGPEGYVGHREKEIVEMSTRPLPTSLDKALDDLTPGEHHVARSFPFGGFAGIVGGLETDGPDPGEKGQRYTAQAVFTGGAASDAVPFMELRVLSFPRSFDKSLADAPPPPPYATSYEVLKDLGKSLRWRVVPGEPPLDAVTPKPVRVPEPVGKARE